MAKKYLKGYGPGVKIFGGIAIATTIIICGYFGFRTYYKPKVTPVQSVNPATQKTTTPAKVNFDGAYSGTSSVANGISSANVTVSGTRLSGRASYSGFGITIPLTVTGDIQRGDSTTRKDGNLQGTFSGSSTLMGQRVSVSGTFSGHIINTSMNVSYSGTASGAGQSQTYPGSITLSKK